MPDNDPLGRRGGGDNGGGGPNMPRSRLMPWLIVPLLLVGLFLFNGWLTSANTESISYSEFVTTVQDGKIAENTTVSISDTTISGTLVNDQGEDQKFSATLSTNFQVDQAFTEFLDTNNVNYEFQQPSVFLQLILNILPVRADHGARLLVRVPPDGRGGRRRR